MKIAVIGATGRTGHLIVQRLLADGHELAVLVRDAAKLGGVAEQVTVVIGTSSDQAALDQLVTGADAVVSALGPTAKEADLHTRTALALLDAMPRHGVRRFVGISGAGIDASGDEKGLRDRLISKTIQTLGGDIVKDKSAEYTVYAGSNLDWTLVRPPRLLDGPGTGVLAHDPHKPGRSSIKRADLAEFVADVAERDLYLGQAPFVWNT